MMNAGVKWWLPLLHTENSNVTRIITLCFFVHIEEEESSDHDEVVSTPRRGYNGRFIMTDWNIVNATIARVAANVMLSQICPEFAVRLME